MFKFEMYEIVKDKVSGYSGVILGRTEYATGCRHYGLAARSVNKEGKVAEWEWFDESRLITDGGILPSFDKNPTGSSGPCVNPPQW
jgi:hypothetical protein